MARVFVLIASIAIQSASLYSPVFMKEVENGAVSARLQLLPDRRPS